MKKRIGVFGDSIVRGHCDYENDGWANLLQKEGFLQYSFSLFELGISGNTTEDLLKRVQVESAARSVNLIIYAIGLNDSARWGGELRVSIEQFRENITSLYDVAKKQGSDVIFIGLTSVDENYSVPVSWDDTLHYLNEDVIEYDEVIRNFCKNSDCLYISMRDLLDDSDLVDGVHPTTDGHKKMFNVIRDELEKNNYIIKNDE